MIVVVEPHSDDAMLSVGTHIQEWVGDESVTVVTVFGNSRRLAEAEAWAGSIGAGWVGLGLPEQDLGKTSTTPVTPEIRRLLKGRLLEVVEGASLVVGPIGLEHPEHVAVRDAVDAEWFYVDQPYARVQRRSWDTSEALAGMRVVSWRATGAQKLLWGVGFRSQSLFFHYNRDTIGRGVELLLESA